MRITARDLDDNMIPYSTLSRSPFKFSKILVVGNFMKQIFIYKILVLEITSIKIFLIFLFIRYNTTIIKQLSNCFFWEIFIISFLLWFSMKLAKVITSSSCTPDHLKSVDSPHFPPSCYLYYILLKFWQLIFQLPNI